MGEFVPHLSVEMQAFVFYVVSLVAFVSCVLFFLYENKSNRNFFKELILAVAAAVSLGTAIFFALVRADVIL
jgi:hypothetical protein